MADANVNKVSMTEKQKVKEITDRLEEGLKELFEGEKYKSYLNTMSKFHNYSANNIQLIEMQCPDATYVAGYKAWQKNFERHVNKGERGVRILAPAPYKIKEEQEKIDPVTNEPVLDRDGMPVMEEVEIKIPAFRVVTVFDYSQTDGKELPGLGVNELHGNVERYQDFMEALSRVSPVPIRYEDMEGDRKGYFTDWSRPIAIKEGMSEAQTAKTGVHEVAHAKLHAREINRETGFDKDRETKEVEAESVAYTVCQHFGIDTSDYSFGYIAGWSSGKEMPELKSSLDTMLRGRISRSDEMIPIDYDDLIEKAEQAEQGRIMRETEAGSIISAFKAKTEELFNGIGRQTQHDIELSVYAYLQSKIDEYGMDIELVDIAVSGSRCRGLEKNGSDLDVVVEYRGGETEDDLFNAFNEDGFTIGGVKVDINPITEGKTGTLAEYLPGVEAYLEGVREAREQEPKSIFSIRMNDEERFFENTSGLDADALCKAYGECRLPFVEMGKYGRWIDIGEYAEIEQGDRLAFSMQFNEETDKITIFDGENFDYKGLRETVYPEQAKKDVKITLTVAECGEFHNLGEYHEDIAGVEEAISIFNSISPDRMNGIPSIGINIHKERDPPHTGQ